MNPPCFVPAASALVAAEFRLILRTCSGPEYAVWLELSYDPELRPDRITMPMPDAHAGVWRRWNKNDPPEVPFKSDKQFPVWSANVRRRKVGSILKVQIVGDVRTLSLDWKLIDQPEFANNLELGRSIIEATIEACTELPDWDREASSIIPPASHLSFYLDARAAQLLPKPDGRPADPEWGVLIRERQVTLPSDAARS